MMPQSQKRKRMLELLQRWQAHAWRHEIIANQVQPPIRWRTGPSLRILHLCTHMAILTSSAMQLQRARIVTALWPRYVRSGSR